MSLTFAKATKAQSKLRCALFGPSGAGKTYTSLRIATGLGIGSIGVIDTERGSASKYADRFDFQVLELEDKSVDGYIAAIKAAAGAGIKVLVIDSMTHAWEDLLAEVDKIAKAKYRGNSWSAWNEGTPKQKALVNALLDYPGHILATMRSRTEWAEEKDERTGKMRPVRVGLAPQQGKGIEYEFDLLLEINPDHYATVIKDRTGRYQDKHLEKPGEDFGKELAAWLSEGVERQESATELNRRLNNEQRQAERVTTGDQGFDRMLKETLPDLLKRCGSREVVDKWLAIVRSALGLSPTMAISAAPDEKRPQIVKAVSLVQDIVINGCLDPLVPSEDGKNALLADLHNEGIAS